MFCAGSLITEEMLQLLKCVINLKADWVVYSISPSCPSVQSLLLLFVTQACVSLLFLLL